ncbi:MAG: ABC transporter transmembrane domain-containing protein [Pseudomonadota bacterium]
MDRNFFRYVWRHSKWAQLWILFVVLASFPIYFLALDLPKYIINGPIQGQGFDGPESRATILKLNIPLPEFAGGGTLSVFEGLELDRTSALVTLSFVFLLLVCVNGGFRFYINLYKGRLGERMLRRLRYGLIDRLVRFPIPRFKRLKSPEIASMVKDEVEPLGGFIGDAFVQPVFLAGQAITVMVFIMMQNYMLGLIALGIVCLQAVIIPRLRRRLAELARQRQLAARELAGRVGEIVDGITDIRTNDASNFERADATSRLGIIYSIRYKFYLRKFAIKFLNNFLALVTPFLFYLVGGYFAIRGELDIGQLVAVIAAYKDLPGPIKELIDWDQNRLNSIIKYEQVVENFMIEGIVPAERQAPFPGTVEPITAPIEVERLTVNDDTGVRLIEEVTLKIAPGEQIAATGETNSGAETVAHALARVVEPARGGIRLNGKSILEVPEATTGRRIGYVRAQPYFRDTSLRNNLTYGLSYHPSDDNYDRSEEDDKKLAFELRESRLAGNLGLRLDADWINYVAAGARNPHELSLRIREVLDIVELLDDVFQMGVRSKLGSDVEQNVYDNLLRCRFAFRRKLETDEDLGRLVEPFNFGNYSRQLSISENLLFGASVDPLFAREGLATNPIMRKVLSDAGIEREIFAIGRGIGETIVELFSDLPPDHPYLEKLSFVDTAELPEYARLLSQLPGDAASDLNSSGAAAFIQLAFDYIEERHRLGLLTPEMCDQIVIARSALRKQIGNLAGNKIEFFDEGSYNKAMTVEENILFGRTVYGLADGPERVSAELRKLLGELAMEDLIVGLGVNFRVGTGGRRLSTAQRQKLAVARALLKRPDLLIVNDGLSNLDPKSFDRILGRVLDLGRNGWHGQRFATFWVLRAAEKAEFFDRSIEFNKGRVVNGQAIAAE